MRMASHTLLAASVATVAAAAAASPSADVRQLTAHENVWTPEFPITVPARAATTDTIAGHTTIPLFSCLDVHSLWSTCGEVSIGTPPQTFRVVFETTEPNTWVINYDIPKSHHAHYNHTDSSTYEADGVGEFESGTQWTYVGFTSRDTIRLGNLTATNMTFVEVLQVTPSVSFNRTRIDGMFGLLPDRHFSNAFWQLVDSGALDKPVFAIYLDRQHSVIGAPARSVSGVEAAQSPNMQQKQIGEITIGDVDKRRYTGSLQYVSTVDGSAWVVALGAITVGSDSSENFVSVGTGKSVKAVVLLSWWQILGPRDDVDRLARAVGADADGSIDCSSPGPDIVFHLGDVTLTLKKRDYALPDTDTDVSGSSKPVGSNARSCSFAFVGADAGGWWLGHPLLRAYYTVLEFDNEGDGKLPRIGFASAV